MMEYQATYVPTIHQQSIILMYVFDII